MEEILSARASSSTNRTPLKSVASLHEDYCALKDCNSTGSGDSGALSGSTDNGTCGNENCNRKSMKSINSINTRKPVIPDLLLNSHLFKAKHWKHISASCFKTDETDEQVKDEGHHWRWRTFTWQESLILEKKNILKVSFFRQICKDRWMTGTF